MAPSKGVRAWKHEVGKDAGQSVIFRNRGIFPMVSVLESTLFRLESCDQSDGELAGVLFSLNMTIKVFPCSCKRKLEFVVKLYLRIGSVQYKEEFFTSESCS